MADKVAARALAAGVRGARGRACGAPARASTSTSGVPTRTHSAVAVLAPARERRSFSGSASDGRRAARSPRPRRADPKHAALANAQRNGGFALPIDAIATAWATPAEEFDEASIASMMHESAPAVVPSGGAGAPRTVAEALALAAAGHDGLTAAEAMTAATQESNTHAAVLARAGVSTRAAAAPSPSDMRELVAADTDAEGADGSAALSALHAADSAGDAAPRRMDGDRVELATQFVSPALRHGFRLLFVGAPEGVLDSLKVVTVAQRTEADMTAWGASVADERSQKAETFHEYARALCASIKAAGYWADYVDPKSGVPVTGPAAAGETLLETDDRYAELGFEVVDFGCCKAVSHAVWGTSVVVGSVFTDAPVDVVAAAQAAAMRAE
mmetsp:Transcript_36510/g.101981  ORF Transcript_36510/g.101981 Transcript_36510/m.101981 type:complete len:387 (+) Transcript_36510:15-1175(+)